MSGAPSTQPSTSEILIDVSSLLWKPPETAWDVKADAGLGGTSIIGCCPHEGVSRRGEAVCREKYEFLTPSPPPPVQGIGGPGLYWNSHLQQDNTKHPCILMELVLFFSSHPQLATPRTGPSGEESGSGTWSRETERNPWGEWRVLCACL